MQAAHVVGLWLIAAAPVGAQDLNLRFPLGGGAAMETTLDLAASALASALQQSRDEARHAGTLPMPPRVREALLAHFPAQLLDSITYRVGLTENATVVTSPFTEAVEKVRGSVVGVNNYTTYRNSY